MTSALDAFRAHRVAAEQLLVRVTEIATLLARVEHQAQTLAHDPDLRAVLQAERTWLADAQHAVRELQAWRAYDRRHAWAGLAWRWTATLVFALAAAAAAGGGAAWATRPDPATRAQRRAHESLGRTVEARRATMTRTERRQFDALLYRVPVPGR